MYDMVYNEYRWCFLQSLKKEVDWSGGVDDKNTGESSSDYVRHPHDSVSRNP